MNRTFYKMANVLQIEDNLRQGMSDEEARAAALRKFGGVEQVKECYRERRGLPVVDATLQDVRYGVRMLRKHKGFTAAAVLSLALGIGANTAIFSLIDALLLKSLPVKDPQQLVIFSIARQGGTDHSFNYPLVERFNQANHSFAGIIASNNPGRMRMSVAEAGGQVEPAQAERVTGNYFSVLGINAFIGRVLTEADDQASGAQPGQGPALPRHLSQSSAVRFSAILWIKVGIKLLTLTLRPSHGLPLKYSAPPMIRTAQKRPILSKSP